ncbi:MAG: hypothetical protein GY847_06990 [Proteobacteria bacterium]|nr:hypothetical protein [Pseudomonadota bacterium]
MDWDDLGGCDLLSDDDMTFSCEYTVNYGDDGFYNLTVSSKDLAGNQASDLTLRGLTIDATLPGLDGDINVSKGVVEQTDDDYSIGFAVDEPLKLSPVVMVGNFDISDDCVANDLQYTCDHVVSAGEGDGQKRIVVTITDVAGNQNIVYTDKHIFYNRSVPYIINSTINPDPAILGKTINVSFTFSEPMTNVDVDWEGLDFELVDGTEICSIDEADAGVDAGTDAGMTGEDCLDFQYEHVVSENDYDGEDHKDYTFFVSAEDLNGAKITDFELGKVKIAECIPGHCCDSDWKSCDYGCDDAGVFHDPGSCWPMCDPAEVLCCDDDGTTCDNGCDVDGGVHDAGTCWPN